MTHVTREELVRWRDQGVADDRERVVSHLATCSSCAAMYAELIRTAPATLSPTHFDPADFVQRGYAVRRDTSTRAWSVALASWKLWAGALSVAAVLTLVVVLGPGVRPGSGPSEMRGSSIELVLPTETTERPSVLEWKSPIAATRYRVELLDAAGAMLYETLTEASRAPLPADVVSKLGPGRSYTWRVTALDADGRAITTSSRTFSIADATR